MGADIVLSPKTKAALARIDAKAIAMHGPDAPITGPYDRCFTCGDRKVECDGPGVVTMTVLRWCIWIAKLAAIEELTYSVIAEEAPVSIATVARIMALDPPENIRWHTVASITKVVIGVDGGRFPCAKHLYEGLEAQLRAALEENDDLRGEIEERERAILKLQQELENLRAELAAKDNTHKAELAAKDDIHKVELVEAQAGAQRKIDFLTKEIERKNQLILQQNAQISKLMSKVLGD